ncbi:MAG: VCBS repeat-containing protein, partial [Gemmatimonas sp.]
MLTASKTGLTHRNDVDDEHGLANRGLLNGAGVALGDVDGDGRPDIFLASVEQPAALYHNDGRMRFTDVSDASGLDFTRLSTTSGVMADVDGDGDLDLIVGTFGGPVKLYANDGRGKFTDVTASSGLSGGYLATTMTLADIDGNGSLDLYVATYKTKNALDVYPPQARAFDQVLRKVGDTVTILEEWKAEYRVEARPDLGGFMRSQRAEPDLFFLNDGHGHFARAPVMGPRFRDEAGNPLTADPDYFTLAARFYDVNGDGAPDLYVCNDLEDPDQFWINDGSGNFRLAPAMALRVTSNTCMSVDFADVNRDGHVDLFTSDMLSPTLEARQRQIPTHTPLQKSVGLSPERTQWMRNMLQLSRGDGTWAQIGDFAGVTATDWTWGSAFLDVDLDGYEDLLAANGHRYDVREADPYERIRNSFPRVPWNRESKEFPRLATTSVAMRNDGQLGFHDVSQLWGFGADNAISHGLALADLDGDGALDVVVTRLDAPSVVYRNESSAPRIAVRLRGTAPNTQGIGAVITVRAPSLPVQSREMTSGGYYLSGSDAQLMFATGADSAVAVDVQWRSGRRSTIPVAHVNRLYEIDEAAALTATAAPVAPARGAPPPLFVDATPLLGGATHVDSLF